jgi:segregation and condensation protein B
MTEDQEPLFDATVMAEIEALLFATDVPLGLDRIQSLTALKDRKSVRNAIEMLRAGYDADGRAFTVVEFGGGYSISTRPEHATLVRKLFKGRRKQRLTRASLEALAIVAYKQPVTRLEIEEIRGVAASGVLGTLLERDLIHIVGRAESLGHPLLYGTTRTLLDYLGLNHVRELPQLSELEDLLAEKEDLKQLAFSRGENLEEEDFERALGEDEVMPPDTGDSEADAADAIETGQAADEVEDDDTERERADDEAEASA